MRIIIDRIEGNIAVVELENMTTADAPISLFPGAVEGGVYTISKDESETADRKQKIQSKFDRLKTE